MRANDNILDMVRAESAETARRSQRGVILQPGGIGDCIVTLPLARFMAEELSLGAVTIVGHTEYIGILPGRSCISAVSSIDAMDLHRLFTDADKFDLADQDPLIRAFSDYSWVVSFLGEPDSDFEKNLIFTINCSRSAEVITLPVKPSSVIKTHIADFYLQQFIEQGGLSGPAAKAPLNKALLEATPADKGAGTRLLAEAGVDISKQLILIHPGSGGKGKCWHLGNFVGVAEKLISQQAEVIFLIGPAERERFRKTQLEKMSSAAVCMTDLSLTEVVQLLSKAKMFVGNDSGITHLAATMGVRTIAVFGPTDPSIYGPIGPNVKVFRDTKPNFAKRPSKRLQHNIIDKVLCQL